MVGGPISLRLSLKIGSQMRISISSHERQEAPALIVTWHVKRSSPGVCPLPLLMHSSDRWGVGGGDGGGQLQLWQQHHTPLPPTVAMAG